MYNVDIENKQLIKLDPKKFNELDLKERFDIQEWIEKTPDILGEELLIISKEHQLPSGKRLDLLAIDRDAKLEIIELKRDDSGSDVEWQAIKYTSYCSNYLHEDIFRYYAEYLETNEIEAQEKIEDFIEEELEKLNKNQRIILVSKEFHPEVISAVLWLRDYEIDLECIRLKPYQDENNIIFITPDIIIPLPEAKDYILKKEIKQKEAKRLRGIEYSEEHHTDGKLPEAIELFQNLNVFCREFDTNNVTRKHLKHYISYSIGKKIFCCVHLQKSELRVWGSIETLVLPYRKVIRFAPLY